MLTINAARSVLEALGDRAANVAIVDNASGDGSADEIAAWIAKIGDDRVQLVRSEVNSGFSGGHNQGMATDPDADYYLILNSDALLLPGFFEPLLEAGADKSVGLIAPQLEDEDGTPTGGRGLLEVSAELRWRREGQLGYVAFLDGANVSNGQSPGLSDLRYSAGLGVR